MPQSYVALPILWSFKPCKFLTPTGYHFYVLPLLFKPFLPHAHASTKFGNWNTSSCYLSVGLLEKSSSFTHAVAVEADNTVFIALYVPCGANIHDMSFILPWIPCSPNHYTWCVWWAHFHNATTTCSHPIYKSCGKAYHTQETSSVCGSTDCRPRFPGRHITIRCLLTGSVTHTVRPLFPWSVCLCPSFPFLAFPLGFPLKLRGGVHMFSELAPPHDSFLLVIVSNSLRITRNHKKTVRNVPGQAMPHGRTFLAGFLWTFTWTFSGQLCAAFFIIKVCITGLTLHSFIALVLVLTLAACITAIYANDHCLLLLTNSCDPVQKSVFKHNYLVWTLNCLHKQHMCNMYDNIGWLCSHPPFTHCLLAVVLMMKLKDFLLWLAMCAGPYDALFLAKSLLVPVLAFSDVLKVSFFP